MAEVRDLTSARRFMASSCKSQCLVAGELRDKLYDVIYSYAGKLPVPTAIGVLQVIQQELMIEATED